MRIPKRILSKLAMSMLSSAGDSDLKLERVICVSASVRDSLIEAGLPIQGARIILGGTDVDRFPPGGKRNGLNGHSKLLYAGQLVPHKGVHTAIEALDKLVNNYNFNQVSLTLVGSGHPDYEAFLHHLVEKKLLQANVTFHGTVAKDRMPDLLQQFDVLIFPSIYEEPLARMVQEAMASGLVVVGTTTGGTKEMLVEGETGLTFTPEDVDGLADQVYRLITNPDMSARLAQAGRQTVLEKFTLHRMVEEIDTYLQKCITESSSAQIKSITYLPLLKPG
jgi:glycogen(starch) synthase